MLYLARVATKSEPEKVTSLVGTFWTDGSRRAIGVVVSKYIVNKIESEKVTNLVGTFWTDGSKNGVIMLYLALVANKIEPHKDYQSGGNLFAIVL